jgi:hypothetical protein
LENIHNLQQEVSDLLEQEDVKWRQRAKENWLKLEIKIPNIFMLVLINDDEQIR